MTDAGPLTDADLVELDRALKRRWAATWVAVIGTPMIACLVAFLISSVRYVWLLDEDARADRTMFSYSSEDVPAWSLSSTATIAIALGTLAALITLFVATVLTAMERDRARGPAIVNRLMLDGLALAACLVGSIACWLAAFASDWSTADGVAGAATAALSGLLLAGLAASAEERIEASQHRAWRTHLGTERVRQAWYDSIDRTARYPPNRRRTFPWRIGLLAAPVVLLPMVAADLVAGVDHWDRWVGNLAVVDAILTALILATWSWRVRRKVEQVRVGRRVSGLSVGIVLLFVPLWALALIATATTNYTSIWVTVTLAAALAFGPRLEDHLNSAYAHQLQRRVRSLEKIG